LPLASHRTGILNPLGTDNLLADRITAIPVYLCGFFFVSKGQQSISTWLALVSEPVSTKARASATPFQRPFNTCTLSVRKAGTHDGFATFGNKMPQGLGAVPVSFCHGLHRLA
jgi:hypothetical protein